MTLDQVRAVSRKLYAKNKDVPFGYWVAGVFVADILGDIKTIRGPIWTIEAKGITTRIVVTNNSYNFETLTPEQYEELDECDRVIFVRVKGLYTEVSATWVDVKVIRDTAEHFHAGSRHDECQRAFRADKWIIDATCLNPMDEFYSRPLQMS